LPVFGQDQSIDTELDQRAIIESGKEEELYNAIQLAIVGDYIPARKKFMELDSAFNAIESEPLRLKLLQWRAYMNKIERRYNEALTDYLKMLRYYEEGNNVQGLTEVHTHLAEFYRARNLKDKSFEHLEIAENLIKNNEVSDCINAYWHSRRAACESQFRSDGLNVKKYAFAGLEFDDTGCLYGTKGMILNELGFQFEHEELDNESKIIGYFQRAIEAFETDKRQRDIITVKNNLSNYYYRRDRLDLALKIINDAINIGERYNWLSALEDSYSIKMAVLDGLGDFEEAYRTSVTAYNKKIELMNYQYSVEVEEIETAYENELTEQALDEARDNAKTNRNAFAYTLLVAGLLLVFAMILVRLFLRIRKNNVNLKSQQRIIRRTNEELTKAVEERELLYKELNHRVKNNLMVLSGLIYIQEETDGNEENKKLYEVLRLRIQSIALVHEKLYGMNTTTEINFQEFLRELISLNFSTLKGGSEISSSVACQNLKVPIDEAIPLALIFNELINNVKKHALNNGASSIQIKAKQTPEEIDICFKDSGRGLPKNFDWRQSSSMGMKIIHLMSQQLKASAKFENEADGLLFEIRLKRKGAQKSA